MVFLLLYPAVSAVTGGFTNLGWILLGGGVVFSTSVFSLLLIMSSRHPTAGR